MRNIRDILALTSMSSSSSSSPDAEDVGGDDRARTMLGVMEGMRMGRVLRKIRVEQMTMCDDEKRDYEDEDTGSLAFVWPSPPPYII